VFLLSTCLFCSSRSDFFLARHSSLGFAACVLSKAATWLTLLLACVSCCLVLCFVPECAVPATRHSPAQTVRVSFCCSRCFIPSRVFFCGRFSTEPRFLRAAAGAGLSHFWPTHTGPVSRRCQTRARCLLRLSVCFGSLHLRASARPPVSFSP
jgi:hypothetical protein